MSGTPHSPEEMSPREAVQRFIRKRKTDSTDRTLHSYRARLKLFADWCAEQGIESIGDLTPWHIDEFDLARRESGLAPATIKSHLTTLRVFLKYCADIGAVDEELPDAVDVPSLDKTEEASDERLAEDDAMEALSFFRQSPGYFGVPMHAFLEAAWHTGARIGGLRGLDIGDYDAERQTLHFRHRPSTNTPLKNKEAGERLVGVSDDVCQALDTYIVRERSDKRDENGREPLFCGRQGRLSFSSLRAWSYQATQPCLWTECPHSRRRPTCEYTHRNHASKCPSSRAPHRIRTGSITWQLNRGLDIEVVAKRVNASPDTIRKFYDAATGEEEFEERRRAVETALDIDIDENE